MIRCQHQLLRRGLARCCSTRFDMLLFCFRELREAHRPVTGALHLVPGEAARDRVEPGRKPALGIVAGAALPETPEHLLNEILSRRPVTDETQEKQKEGRTVAVEQL